MLTNLLQSQPKSVTTSHLLARCHAFWLALYVFGLVNIYFIIIKVGVFSRKTTSSKGQIEVCLPLKLTSIWPFWGWVVVFKHNLLFHTNSNTNSLTKPNLTLFPQGFSDSEQNHAANKGKTAEGYQNDTHYKGIGLSLVWSESLRLSLYGKANCV